MREHGIQKRVLLAYGEIRRQLETKRGLCLPYWGNTQYHELGCRVTQYFLDKRFLRFSRLDRRAGVVKEPSPFRGGAPSVSLGLANRRSV